jgi:hypothetical protein
MSDSGRVFTGGKEESRAAVIVLRLGTIIAAIWGHDWRLNRSVFQTGRKKEIRLLETTLYARDQGPKCFEAEIFSQHESAEAFVEQLRECGLTWYWHSVREEGQPAAPEQPELPRYRPLTPLTDQNWHDLVLDIDEKVGIWHMGNRTLATVDIEPYAECRNLMLFGLDAEFAAPVEASLDEAAHRFLQDIGPLEIVFNRVQDLTYEFLFFRHEISPEVRCLLDAWRLDPEHPPKCGPIRNWDQLNWSIFCQT